MTRAQDPEEEADDLKEVIGLLEDVRAAEKTLFNVEAAQASSKIPSSEGKKEEVAASAPLPADLMRRAFPGRRRGSGG